MDELAGKGAFEMIGPCMYSGTGKMPQGSCGRVHDSSKKIHKIRGRRSGRRVFLFLFLFGAFPRAHNNSHAGGVTT